VTVPVIPRRVRAYQNPPGDLAKSIADSLVSRSGLTCVFWYSVIARSQSFCKLLYGKVKRFKIAPWNIPLGHALSGQGPSIHLP